MNSFKTLSAFAALILFLSELFVTYSILTAIHPGRLIWFMFWISIASSFSYMLFAVLGSDADKAAKKGGGSE